MPVSKDFSSVYTHEWTINFTQCNPQGSLKYTELCNILQLTAGYHAELGGISFTDMQTAGQAWVLSRMRIEIDDLPRWRDVITVRTWIVSLENSRSVRALEVYCGDKKLVGCETLWYVFNTTSRRPEALALPHLHFEKYEGRYATKDRVNKIEAGEAIEIAGYRTAAVSDLDIVSHVNNVKYLEWCLDLADPRIVLGSKILSLEMNYLRELLLGDAVDILQSTTSDPIVFAISKGSKNYFTLQLTAATSIK